MSIYQLLGDEYLLAYLGSVYDLISFGSTCKDAARMTLNLSNVFFLLNNNVRSMIKEYGFASIEELKSFLRSYNACLSGSFLLRSLGVPVENKYERELTDLDLFIYCDCNITEFEPIWANQLFEYESTRDDFDDAIPIVPPALPEVPPVVPPVPPRVVHDYNQLYTALRSKGFWLTGFNIPTGTPYETGVAHFEQHRDNGEPYLAIDVVYTLIPTSDYIKQFDIDICQNIIGVVSSLCNAGTGQVRYEEVIDIPQLRNIITKRAHIHPVKKTKYIDILPEIWKAQFDHYNPIPPLSAAVRYLAKIELNRIYKYYSRGFDFPDVYLPPVWSENYPPDTWGPLLHHPTGNRSTRRSLDQLNDRIFKVIS
jgi:hypothetical protein